MGFAHNIGRGIFAVLWGLFIATASAAKKEPLTNHVTIFNEMDANLRAADPSVSSTNHIIWMEAAIQTKRDLRLNDEIEPWLEELSTANSKDWKVLHAVTRGYSMVYERWESIQCMDLAFRLARDSGAGDKAIGQLCLDYIDLLLYDRLEDSYDLLVKTPGTTVDQYSEALYHLDYTLTTTNTAGDLVTYDLNNLPDLIWDNIELTRWFEQNQRQYKRNFYALPDS